MTIKTKNIHHRGHREKLVIVSCTSVVKKVFKNP